MGRDTSGYPWLAVPLRVGACGSFDPTEQEWLLTLPFRCGDTVSVMDAYMTSFDECQTACPDDASSWCGGAAATVVYSQKLVRTLELGNTEYVGW